MSKPVPVIVEIDADGVRSVYCDDPHVRVVIVDHSWDEDVMVTCPFPSPGPLTRCDSSIRVAATTVIQTPNVPNAIPKTAVGSDA